jgi:tRNA(Ile)-lysidine synthase
MDIAVPEGRYVVAVSGGVDSVTLLHVLVEQVRAAGGKPGNRFVVAHFDHGIRPESADDRRFVQALARQYGLPFVYERAELGAHASEAVARKARYAFLGKVQQASGAAGVITAHHQDDLLETAVLNLVRGTRGRGLHSLGTRGSLHRPMMTVQRREILAYAREHELSWCEDATNQDESTLRNYVRHRYVTPMQPPHREELLHLHHKAAEITAEIDAIIAEYLRMQPTENRLNRASFIELPHTVAREVMAVWLRERSVGIELNRRMLERLVVAAKAGKSGSRVDIANGYRLLLSSDHIELLPPQ